MSWAAVETVLVKAWHATQGLFVEINKSEFDPAVHELYVEGKSEVAGVGDESAKLAAEAKAKADPEAAALVAPVVLPPPPAPVEQVAEVPAVELPAAPRAE